MSGPPDVDLQRLIGAFGPTPPETLGVAVSGGSDSTALLCLLAEWQGGPALEAVTVNHGLRTEATQEAEDVATLCARLGVPHTVLHWSGWDGQGNLPDQARRARYALMADWASDRRIKHIALGHTGDDLAETLVMRLARGSGLDGVSAMPDRFMQSGVTFLRPLLSEGRDALRTQLRKRGQGWAEDATNTDEAYERARVRKAMVQLAELGISSDRLIQTARRLRTSRDDLNAHIWATIRDEIDIDSGDLLIPNAAVDAMSGETLRRVVQAGLIWVSGADYPPRADSLEQMITRLRDGGDSTLHGCRVLRHKGHVRLMREWKAVSELRGGPEAIWDGRWQLFGPATSPDLEIAALGEAGLPQCPDRKSTGRPAASLIASPAVWRGDRLVAAPLAGLENGWRVTLVRDRSALKATLLSH